MSVVCLCRGSIVQLKPEEQDQGGRKRLRGRLSGRKEGRQEGRDGEVIPRSQRFVPAPTAANS